MFTDQLLNAFHTYLMVPNRAVSGLKRLGQWNGNGLMGIRPPHGSIPIASSLPRWTYYPITPETAHMPWPW